MGTILPKIDGRRDRSRWFRDAPGFTKGGEGPPKAPPEVQLRTNKVNKFGGRHTLIFCDLNHVRKWKVTWQTHNWHTYEDICTSRLSLKGHLRVFGPQNLAVCQNNVLKIWKYAQSTDLDVVVPILKYEKILASHSHGKKCTKCAYQSSQVPMFNQNQPQISPKSAPNHRYISKNDTRHSQIRDTYWREERTAQGYLRIR